MAYIDVTGLELDNELDFIVTNKLGTYITKDSGSIQADMQLDMTAYGHIPHVSESISIDMDMDMSVTSKLIAGSGHATMFMTLGMHIAGAYAYCADYVVDFEPQMITIDTCEEEQTVEIERYKNDTYPLEISFSREGNHSTDGLTFTMYTQLDGDTLYTSTGTIIDTYNGIVIFNFDADAVNEAGSGVYEIKVSGTDVATYAHGIFIIKDTLA